MQRMNNKKAFLTLASAALLPVSCGYGTMGPHMGTGYGGMDGYYGYGGVLMWILLLVAGAAVVYVLMKKSGPGGNAGMGPRETPLDILKRRYASGEIDRETFERMKQDLDR